MTPSRPIGLMIVEDERVVAFDLKNQLQAFGYQVKATVASGEQAVQRVAEVAPDVVLMDIHLEGAMDGVQAATEIQARYQVPVIYLTAYAEDDTLLRAMASRPFGYLVKPWDTRELHATIQMALSRREVEIAVEDSERRLKLAIDAASLGVFEWWPLANRLQGDGHLYAIFGDQPVPLDESWENFLARVDADDRRRVSAALEATLASDVATRLEFRTTPEAGPHYIEANVRAYPAAGGGKRVVGVLQDVSERHHTEEKLRQSSAVFSTAAEAIVIVDAGRRISAINDAFTRITGFGEAESLGFDVDLLLRTQRDDPDSEDFFAELVGAAEGYWQGEVYCQRHSGERFPAWQSLSVVRNRSGQVSHFVIAFSDVSEIHLAAEKLNHLAHHDMLTGLPNRLLFEDRFEQAIELSRRQHQQCLLLFIDLDSFKVVNDTLGHIMGDELLRVVAGRLRGTLRAADTIARLGGDEFVIVAGGTGPQYAGELAEKILHALAEPVPLGGDAVTVSASIGIAVFPDHGGDRHELTRAADIAMYSAKAAGRNGYQFYNDAMAERSNERLHLEQGLRRAIDESQLQVHYQPQVSLADGNTIGVEALVRWAQDEPGGMISPARFIPIAEECGLIDRLGHWVLEHACREVRGLVGSDGRQLRLSVNVAVREFMRDDFVDSVRATLEYTGFPPSALEFEITESTLQVFDRSVEIIARLKSLGIAVAIDDFGTGYSSLAVLRDLPIDRIKVDRSFIHDIPDNVGGIAILQAIVALAGSLHLDIIVEGIERLEQALLLHRMGCGAGQGYLFSHPVGRAALLNYLATDGAEWR